MTVSWTPHRFTGGLLALDTANTVVLRTDPDRTFDRFADTREIGRFAEAASGFRAAELGGRRLDAQSPGELSGFLGACSTGLAGSSAEVGSPGRPFGDPATPIAFEVALAVSALSLLRDDTVGRLRICPNCAWLFVDRSRNSSRLWCDMKVCGNRQKASRHYRRRVAASRVGNTEVGNA